MAEDIKRQVAQKVWIKNIIGSPFVKSEGWNPSYVDFKGRKVARVNLLATVVSKYLTEDSNYGSITLDDGSETIRVKAFGPDVPKVAEAEVGELVRFVGKIKHYNDELYLYPEVIRAIDDPNWVLVRKLELGSIPTKQIKISVSEDVAEDKIKEKDENLTAKVIALIEKDGSEDGAPMDKIIADSGLSEEEAKNIIIGLLESGDVYEPKKGKLKVL